MRYDVEHVATGERYAAWSGYFFWTGDLVSEEQITFDDPVEAMRVGVWFSRSNEQ
jgi:hypothetical protein